MSFRKILMGSLTILLGVAGVGFGLLFLLCLSLYLLWQSWLMGIAFSGLICLISFALARAALREMGTKERLRIGEDETVKLP